MKKLSQMAFDAGIMPILFADKEDDIKRVVSAIERTEIPAVEILQRGDMAKNVLKEAVKIKKNALIGAGTVCTLEHCKEMVDMGADFIVSPGFNPEMVEWCAKNNVLVIPGVSNTSEVMLAHNAGFNLLKAFPFNELGGTRFFDSIAGPFPDVKFVATGFLGGKDLHLLSNKRIAAIGGVWMFQGEEDHTVHSEEKIVEIINENIARVKLYRTEE